MPMTAPVAKPAMAQTDLVIDMDHIGDAANQLPARSQCRHGRGLLYPAAAGVEAGRHGDLAVHHDLLERRERMGAWRDHEAERVGERHEGHCPRVRGGIADRNIELDGPADDACQAADNRLLTVVVRWI